MSLRVYGDKAKTQLICGAGAVHRKCTLPAPGVFVVEVVADQPPAGGYTAYNVVVQYEGEIVLQQAPGLAENKAPTCGIGTESKQPGNYNINCKLGPTTYDGPLANAQFDCADERGTVQIDLVGGSTAQSSYYVSPSVFGNLVFLKSVAKPGDTKLIADAVLVNCGPQPSATPTVTLPPGVTATPTKQPAPFDTDQDGCTDVAENGPNANVGGRRNYLSFWDFYDVWTHPAGQPNVWVRDGAINATGDILGVANRFGPGPVPPAKAVAQAQALVPPVSDTGYHIAFDRGPQIGADPWDLAPPDGVITVAQDMVGVAAQFGHLCN
jgi:hypothetical protein